MKIEMPTHYENGRLENFEHLKKVVPEYAPNEDNWVFVGTSGVHGSYTKLDAWPEQTTFTVLVVRPRLVSCLWGEVKIESEEDYNWLRDAIKETVDVIEKTQPEYEYKKAKSDENQERLTDICPLCDEPFENTLAEHLPECEER